MKKRIIFIFLFLILVLLTGCEKKVRLDKLDDLGKFLYYYNNSENYQIETKEEIFLIPGSTTPTKTIMILKEFDDDIIKTTFNDIISWEVVKDDGKYICSYDENGELITEFISDAKIDKMIFDFIEKYERNDFDLIDGLYYLKESSFSKIKSNDNIELKEVSIEVAPGGTKGTIYYSLVEAGINANVTVSYSNLDMVELTSPINK